MSGDCPICCNYYTEHLRRRVECLHCQKSSCRSCVSNYILSSPLMPRCMYCLKDWNREFMYNSMTKTFVVDTLKKHTEKLMVEREKALLPATQPIVERTRRINELYQANQVINNQVMLKRRDEKDVLYTLRVNLNDHVTNGLRLKSTDIQMVETLTDSDQSDDERDKIHRFHARLPQQLQEDIQRWKRIHREVRALEENRQANYEIIQHLVRLNRRRIQMIHPNNNNAATLDYVTSESEEDDNDPEGHAMDDERRRRKKKRVFVRSCPKEGCRGFLNQRWVCGLCDTRVCSKCHEIRCVENEKKVEHMCDPNNVATAQMLMRDTKGCPKCGTQIHKIDGCDMMFCTQCHTPFCWRTGEIITNQRIHNPHYYEWLRQNSTDGNIPREPGDVVGNPCDDRIPIRMIREKLRHHDLLSYDVEDRLWNIHRISVHIELVEVPRLLRYRENNNVDLRIQYLSNQLPERAWQHELYRRAKQDEKNKAVRDIYEMVHMVVHNEFRKMLASQQLTFQNIQELMATFENLRVYTNEQFLEISRLYQCRVPKIEEGMWQIGSQRVDPPRRKRAVGLKEETVCEDTDVAQAIET